MFSAGGVDEAFVKVENERVLEATFVTTEWRQLFTGQTCRRNREYADEHGTDLVRMGATGWSGLNRYLLDSTAERLIKHAETPVLAINAREQTGQ